MEIDAYNLKVHPNCAISKTLYYYPELNYQDIALNSLGKSKAASSHRLEKIEIDKVKSSPVHDLYTIRHKMIWTSKSSTGEKVTNRLLDPSFRLLKNCRLPLFITYVFRPQCVFFLAPTTNLFKPKDSLPNRSLPNTPTTEIGKKLLIIFESNFCCTK